MLARYQGDFPGLPDACKHVLPLLGRGLLRSFADDLEGAHADFSAVEPAGARWGPFVFRIGSLSHLASVVDQPQQRNHPPSEKGSA